MISAMHEAAEVLAARHPLVIEGIKECHKAGFVVAAFSSQRGFMGALACGVTLDRQPRDFDLRTTDFWGAVNVLEAEVEENVPISTLTGDGLAMEFRAHRAKASLGIEVEFMMPLEPVCIDGRQFPSTFTDEHARDLTIYQTELGPLPVDDRGTFEVYTLRQATGKKQDLIHAALVLATTTPDKYEAFLRAAALPATDRMTRFRREVATAARHFMNEGVLPVAA